MRENKEGENAKTLHCSGLACPQLRIKGTTGGGGGGRPVVISRLKIVV